MSAGRSEIRLDLAAPPSVTPPTSPASQPESVTQSGPVTGSVAPQRYTGFLRDLADQLRAGDTYGRFDRFPDEHLLRPLIITAVRRAEIPVNCDVDPATEGRVRSFYQAVAVGIEKRTTVLTSAVVDLSHEGFGRALVLAGRLVVVVDVLRDAQRFGFPDAQALAARGDHLVAAGTALIEAFPEVARADD